MREGICIELEVKVFDKKGKLIERRKKSDLILNNFKKFLAATFQPEVTVSATTDYTGKTVSLTDTTGTARTVYVYGSYRMSTYDNRNVSALSRSGYTSVGAYNLGTRIRIGTGTVAPTRDDYALGSEVANAIPSQTIGADYITWAVAITLETAQDISEAGLSMLMHYGIGGTSMAHFLMFRDTFTPVSVPAGGTISVTYKLSL